MNGRWLTERAWMGLGVGVGGGGLMGANVAEGGRASMYSWEVVCSSRMLCPVDLRVSSEERGSH